MAPSPRGTGPITKWPRSRSREASTVRSETMKTVRPVMRITGRTVFIVSDLTVLASRERDRGHFVIGPVPLGLGAMLALLLYPSTAAAIAVYALAFGDGLASLAGKMFHTPRIPGTRGKTVAGRRACFTAVLLSCLRLTGSPWKALLLAPAGTAPELVPVRDFDKPILPGGTGFL